jgi:hypothetical protein
MDGSNSSSIEELVLLISESFLMMRGKL